MTVSEMGYMCPCCEKWVWPREMRHLDILPRFIYGVDLLNRPTPLIYDWSSMDVWNQTPRPDHVPMPEMIQEDL